MLKRTLMVVMVLLALLALVACGDDGSAGNNEEVEQQGNSDTSGASGPQVEATNAAYEPSEASPNDGAQGNDVPGTNTEGTNTEGSDTEGSSTEGSDTEGSGVPSSNTSEALGLSLPLPAGAQQMGGMEAASDGSVSVTYQVAGMEGADLQAFFEAALVAGGYDVSAAAGGGAQNTVLNFTGNGADGYLTIVDEDEEAGTRFSITLK